MQLHVTRDIDAPAQRVWELITDIEHAPETLSGVEQVERLDDGGGFGVGTRWRETRTMFGKQATEEMEVTTVEPERAYTTVAQHGNTRYVSSLRVEPLGEGRCQLSMTFEGTSSSTVGRLLTATVGRLFAGSTRKMVEQDLHDIAVAAEASTTD